MVEKFESGLIDPFCLCFWYSIICQCYFALKLLLSTLFFRKEQNSLWFMVLSVMQVCAFLLLQGWLIISKPVHGCNSMEDLFASLLRREKQSSVLSHSCN